MSNHTALWKLLGIWLVISILIGLPLCCVPWGKPGAFHGRGFPFPIFALEINGDTGGLTDFIYPISLVLNPLLIFILGAVPIILSRCWQRWRRRCISNKNA